MDAVVPNLEDLLKNLNHQLALYRQMMELVRNERECIVGVKVKELREATYSKEAILDEIQREENRRVAWMREAAKFLQLPLSEITMDVIAARFAPERYEALMSLKNTLTVLIKKVKDTNLENRRLIEVALKDAQEMKKNILGLTSEQPKVYGPKGNMGGSVPEKGARILNQNV